MDGCKWCFGLLEHKEDCPVLELALLKSQLAEALKRNAVLTEALRRIAEHETLSDGDKYINHRQAWVGVAAFARQALSGEPTKAGG